MANFSSSLPSLGVPPLRIVPMNHVERGVVPHIAGRSLAAAETKARGRKEGRERGREGTTSVFEESSASWLRGPAIEQQHTMPSLICLILHELPQTLFRTEEFYYKL